MLVAGQELIFLGEQIPIYRLGIIFTPSNLHWFFNLLLLYHHLHRRYFSLSHTRMITNQLGIYHIHLSEYDACVLYTNSQVQ